MMLYMTLTTSRWFCKSFFNVPMSTYFQQRWPPPKDSRPAEPPPPRGGTAVVRHSRSTMVTFELLRSPWSEEWLVHVILVRSGECDAAPADMGGGSAGRESFVAATL